MKLWLQNNKIYFETAMAFLLSIMALIVSGFQLYLGFKEKDLLQTQLLVSKANSNPQIYVDLQLVYDDKIQFFTDENIEIKNIGNGPAFETVSNCIVFLQASLQEKKSPTRSANVNVALTNYYNATFNNLSPDGLLFTIKGINNNLKIGNISNEFFRIARDKEYYGNLKLSRIVHITYKNIMGETISKYFLVEPVTGVKEIGSQAGQKYFEEYQRQVVNNQNINFITIQSSQILDKVEIKLRNDT